ncbi:hypothetical protein T4C_4877 [Trichinella pseudospiralis]|uniref:Uncharacterized protein n=1 Tax=Trichinella pseudospiralis TaxID=6337 RepID=A0A0V1IM04_TRIPS|nr:hypothetical protein T4C_4877 [Trichinella pseudospiralis]KRZ23806.1 hypothetical protein T4C_4877 [Trichinella pseudospiralis]
MKINYDALKSMYLSCEQNWLRKFISRIVKQYLKLSQPDNALLYENFTNTVLLLLLLSSSRFASAKNTAPSPCFAIWLIANVEIKWRAANFVSSVDFQHPN